jgi:hypothetical protein
MQRVLSDSMYTFFKPSLKITCTYGKYYFRSIGIEASLQIFKLIYSFSNYEISEINLDSFS